MLKYVFFSVILYEVFSRRDPYEGENPKEMFELVSAYLAHNLEDALYEFASFQISSDCVSLLPSYSSVI